MKIISLLCRFKELGVYCFANVCQIVFWKAWSRL